MFSFSRFNRDISDWDVSMVETMIEMFYTTFSFNQDISSWNVGSVTDMTRMFEDAVKFNVDIGNWDVSHVTDLSLMFYYAESFDQQLCWDINNDSNIDSMFTGSYGVLLPFPQCNTESPSSSPSMNNTIQTEEYMYYYDYTFQD